MRFLRGFSVLLLASAVLITGFFLVGCKWTTSTEGRNAGKDQVLLYAPYDSRLVIYGIKVKAVQNVSAVGSGPLYEFSDPACRLYVVTDEEGMRIVSVDEKRGKIKNVAFFKEEVYPLAWDKEKNIGYYVRCQKEDNEVRDVIAVDRRGKVRVIAAHAGMITSGALTEDGLYLTKYDKERDEYRLLIRRGKQLEDTERVLHDDDLFTRNGVLLCSDESSIYSIDGTFRTAKSDFVYFPEGTTQTLKMNIGRKHLPQLTIENDEGKVLKKYEDVIGFWMQGTTVHVAGNGYMRTYSAGKGKEQ